MLRSCCTDLLVLWKWLVSCSILGLFGGFFVCLLFECGCADGFIIGCFAGCSFVCCVLMFGIFMCFGVWILIIRYLFDCGLFGDC